QAIRDGKLPEDVNDREKDVIRWLLEARETRLRRKRDIKELSADFKRERAETRSQIKTLLDNFAREREVTRANWQAVQAKVVRGKRQVDRIRQGLDYETKAEEPPLESSEKENGQIGEGM
ncbi:MAG: hypothetical protein QMC90_03835, partial [Dehalococcoidales bacterium]|nr:hypothetical protein [Dehalococcoidales bacterium]